MPHEVEVKSHKKYSISNKKCPTEEVKKILFDIRYTNYLILLDKGNLIIMNKPKKMLYTPPSLKCSSSTNLGLCSNGTTATANTTSAYFCDDGSDGGTYPTAPATLNACGPGTTDGHGYYICTSGGATDTLSFAVCYSNGAGVYATDGIDSCDAGTSANNWHHCDQGGDPNTD